MAAREFAEDYVSDFYQVTMILCREGGLTHADVMSLTRQGRYDRMHALGELLKALEPKRGRDV